MSINDLNDQLKQVCIAVTHEAMDPRLTASEVFEYLTVVNSAAQISMKLSRRIDRIGLDETQNDIFRFVDVAVRKILKVRQAVEQREHDPLANAWMTDDE